MKSFSNIFTLFAAILVLGEAQAMDLTKFGNCSTKHATLEVTDDLIGEYSGKNSLPIIISHDGATQVPDAQYSVDIDKNDPEYSRTNRKKYLTISDDKLATQFCITQSFKSNSKNASLSVKLFDNSAGTFGITKTAYAFTIRIDKEKNKITYQQDSSALGLFMFVIPIGGGTISSTEELTKL